MRSLVLRVIPAAVLALASCSGGQAAKEDDPLLDRADVSPLRPSSVTPAQPGAYSGTQYWSCSDNDGVLEEEGWSITVRDLRNTEDNWALYSAVLDNPDADATAVLDEVEARVVECTESGDARLEEVDLGEDDTYAYRSVTPEGRVDTVRAYAVVDEHRLVQLTLLGLNDQSAPDEIKQLVRTATEKAS
jgi:hypothetical protein